MLAKQLPILSDVDTYDIEGVIYAIIYLRSSRVYVGQTIRSSFHRFKKHFSDANNHDSKNCHLHNLCYVIVIYIIISYGHSNV